jgi:hypothetical protein
MSPLRAILSGPNVKKIAAVFTNVRNKLECLSLTNLSSLGPML